MASGGMLGKTGQRLGLDSLKIEGAPDSQSLDFDPTAVNSEANPASRLTFSKRLASNLSATFSRSLTKAGNYTWFVAWKAEAFAGAARRAARRPERRPGVSARHHAGRRQGGRASRSPATTATAERRDGDRHEHHGGSRVTRASDLKMQVGQPFDYERWLDDRDRLEGRAGREGYGEGRVLAQP